MKQKGGIHLQVKKIVYDEKVSGFLGFYVFMLVKPV